eukprot:scaffold139334_cov425-Phaeocystis_antarctica.AAC.1
MVVCGVWTGSRKLYTRVRARAVLVRVASPKRCRARGQHVPYARDRPSVGFDSVKRSETNEPLSGERGSPTVTRGKSTLYSGDFVSEAGLQPNEKTLHNGGLLVFYI